MSPNISNYLKYCINSFRSVDTFLIVPVSSEILLIASAISDTFAVTSSLLAAFSSLIALSSVILFIIVCFFVCFLSYLEKFSKRVLTFSAFFYILNSEIGYNIKYQTSKKGENSMSHDGKGFYVAVAFCFAKQRRVLWKHQ